MTDKLALQVTAYEFSVIRELLGKSNDSVGVERLFNRMADRQEKLNIPRVDLEFISINGTTYAIGKE